MFVLGNVSPSEIFNTDQGSQFTSGAFTGRLQAAGTARTDEPSAGKTLKDILDD